MIDACTGTSEPKIWRLQDPRPSKALGVLRAARRRTVQRHRALVLAALETSVLGLATSPFKMVFYDRILPNGAVDSLLALVAGVGFVLLIYFLIQNLRQRFIDTVGKRVNRKIAERLFNQLMALKMKSRRGQNERMGSILRDFEVVRDFSTSAFLVALIDLPFLFVFIGMIWAIGGTLALDPAIAVPITLLSGLLAQPFLSQYARESSVDDQTKQSVLMETQTGMETLKTTGAEPVMRAR